MGQKVHPTNLRLGSLFSWKDSWYSINYSDVSYQNIKIFNYLKRVLIDYNCILGSCNVLRSYGQVNVYLTYYSLTDESLNKTPDVLCNQVNKRLVNLKVLPDSKKVPWGEMKLALQSWMGLSVVFNYYKENNIINNANFIAGYIRFKVESNESLRGCLKQVMNEFSKSQHLLVVRSNLYQSNYYSLKGLKVLCSGRLRGVRSRISTKESIFVGSILLHSYHKYINYALEEAYTKYGMCGIKVWLFYEFKI